MDGHGNGPPFPTSGHPRGFHSKRIFIFSETLPVFFLCREKQMIAPLQLGRRPETMTTTDPPPPTGLRVKLRRVERLRRTSYRDVADGTFELRHSVIRSTPARESFRSSAFFSFPRSTAIAAVRLNQPTTRHGWPWEWSAPDNIQTNN